MSRKLSDREESFLKDLGAKPTFNSGAVFGDGDGLIKNRVTDDISVEVKATDAKSYSLKADTWKKIKKEAQRLKNDPLLAIDIQGTKLVVLDMNDFIELLEGANWIPERD